MLCRSVSGLPGPRAGFAAGFGRVEEAGEGVDEKLLARTSGSPAFLARSAWKTFSFLLFNPISAAENEVAVSLSVTVSSMLFASVRAMAFALTVIEGGTPRASCGAAMAEWAFKRIPTVSPQKGSAALKAYGRQR